MLLVCVVHCSHYVVTDTEVCAPFRCLKTGEIKLKLVSIRDYLFGNVT